MDKKQGPPDSDGAGLTLDELMFVGAPSVCSPETQAKIVEEARNRLEDRRDPSPQSRSRLVRPKGSWFRRFLSEPFFSPGAFGGAVAASFILAFGYMRLFGPAVSPVLLQEQLTFKGGAQTEKLQEVTQASRKLENKELLREITLLKEQINKSAKIIALQDEALALAQQPATLRTQQPVATTQASEVANVVSKRATSTDPVRASFEFYTVLPDVERVVSVEETTPQTQLSKEPVKQSVKNQDSDGYYMLQVGSYSKQSIAEKMKENLAITGFEPAIQRVNIQGQGQLFRVQVGPFATMESLEKANRKLEQMGFKTLWLKVSKRP